MLVKRSSIKYHDDPTSAALPPIVPPLEIITLHSSTPIRPRPVHAMTLSFLSYLKPLLPAYIPTTVSLFLEPLHKLPLTPPVETKRGSHTTVWLPRRFDPLDLGTMTMV